MSPFLPIPLAPPFHLVGPSLAQTRADILAAYLSGAGVDGGVQTDPADALGGYRSSSRADGLGVLITSPIPGVRIDYASPANLAGLGRTVNGVGLGSLRAMTVEGAADYLVWTPPVDVNGDDAESGDPVAITEDETKLLAGGGTTGAGQFLIVTRTSADELAGQATVQLTRTFNDLFGQSNADIDVSTDPTYRLVVFRAGSGVVKNLKIWIGADTDGTVRIAREDPSSQPDGDFQTIADETTAPTGVTWVSPTSAVHVDVITIATIRPGEIVGLWIERTVDPAASPRQILAIEWSATLVG